MRPRGHGLFLAFGLLARAAWVPKKDTQAECEAWARGGECAGNPDFMLSNCAASCARTDLVIVDGHGEPEQCLGWAAQGECTRNPKYMMATCAGNCADQRSKVVDGLLDVALDCVDSSTADSCRTPAQRERCAGSCGVLDMCASDPAPAECAVALRCRELKDERADCADRVRTSGCDAYALKACYLSCARHDLRGLLARFRRKMSVRTRMHGLIDEDRAPHGHSSTPVGRGAHDLPCWRGTPHGELPPSTCPNGRAALSARWRGLAQPRCAALGATTPRAGARRAVALSPAIQSALPDGHVVHVLPLLRSPKIRIVESIITRAEAEHILSIGMPRMHRSLAGGRTESIRTSTTAALPASDAVVRAVTERAAHVTGYPYENVEPLQLVRYEPGQKYEPHFDYGEACDFEENEATGPRHVTMLIYLNDLPDADGGHTVFPRLDLKVSPRAHAAVVFNDCHADGGEDARTLHGGTPPLSNATKAAINVWIRAGGFRRGRAAASALGGALQAQLQAELGG